MKQENVVGLTIVKLPYPQNAKGTLCQKADGICNFTHEWRFVSLNSFGREVVG